MAYTGRILLSLGRSQQIKDLKVALQCLFKIGSELLVEGLDDRVSRCMYASRYSACKCMHHPCCWCGAQIYAHGRMLAAGR